MFLECPPAGVLGEVDKHSPAAHWFRQLSKQLALPVKPKAIVVITAHWETSDAVQISGQDQHTELLYDYGGFPAEAYELTYRPPGDRQLAERIRSLLKDAGIAVQLNDRRHFDHGVFIPLKLIYPDADIPVVALSILKNLSPSEHLAIGAALAPLRDEQILLIGSGSSVHGFRATEDQCKGFVSKLTEVLTKAETGERREALANWEKVLPFARQNHPREEHLIPLHVIVGAAGSSRGQWLNPRVTPSQAAFRFG